jgi:hypothetical protein
MLEVLKAEMNKIRQELNEHRRTYPHTKADRVIDRANNALDYFDGTGRFDEHVTAALTALLAEISKPTFGFETPEMKAWSAKEHEIIVRYNAVVERYNGELQARRNAREVAKVRAAACPECFVSHVGDCY